LTYIFKNFKQDNNNSILNILKDNIILVEVMENQFYLFSYIKQFLNITLIFFSNYLLLSNNNISFSTNYNNKFLYFVKNHSSLLNNYKGIKLHNMFYSENQIIFI
jgi:hypothetical protein